MPSRRILLVGAGFAGFALARALDAQLARTGTDAIHATLVAPGPFAQLSPLLPGLLSGWVEPWHLLVPLQSSLRHVRWIPGRAVSFDASAHTVAIDSAGVRNRCDPAALPFDDLVLALGAKPSLDPVPGAAAHALPFDNVDDALRIRNRVADALDAAAAEESGRRRRALLTIAVIGSSPRACAVALESAALLREACRHHPRIRPDEPRVVLLAPGEHACGNLAPRHAFAVDRLLGEVGIEVQTHRVVTRVDDRHVLVQASNGVTEHMDARTVVWAADGTATPLLAPYGPWRSFDGTLRVDETLRVIGATDVFALGACASAPSPTHILAHARMLARNFVARAKGRPLQVAAAAPIVVAHWLDRDWGLATVGARQLTGQAAACIARNMVLSLAPRWSHRQAVRASWALRRLSWPGVAPRLQPAGQSLYLTEAPPVAAQRSYPE